MLQETVSREQNLRFAEMHVLVRLFERMIGTLYESTTKPEHILERRKELGGMVDELLKAYESELYQDRYSPAHQQAARERTRKSKQQVLDARAREARALQKVAAFSEEPKPKKKR